MLVQRWPAVPAAEKTMPRVARSRSADGPTIAALLPPSSSRERPNRAATRGPTSRPIRVEPVAESSATAGSSTRARPTAASPRTTCATSGEKPDSDSARDSREDEASAHSGACSEGFQTTVSPHTRAMAVFHDHTATGKLNAEITPTTPSGCQVSISRWPGRSEVIVRPNSCRDSPTA